MPPSALGHEFWHSAFVVQLDTQVFAASASTAASAAASVPASLPPLPESVPASDPLSWASPPASLGFGLESLSLSPPHAATTSAAARLRQKAEI